MDVPGSGYRSPPPVVPPPLPEPAPWNGWWTLLWGVAVMVAILGSQMVVLLFGMVFALSSSSRKELQEPDFLLKMVERLSTDGDLLSFSLLVSAGVVCGLCLLLGKLRRGFTARGYLALVDPPLGRSVFWIAVILVMVVSQMLLAGEAGSADLPQFMRDLVESTSYRVLLVIGIVVAAPVWEELFFRGLLFRGWRASKLGLHGTVVVTSLGWSMLHAFQYGAAQLAWLFVIGIVLGYARHRTGSVWVPIAMHGLNNLIATILIFQVLGRGA